jgi:small subunit ribosomal protein S19
MSTEGLVKKSKERFFRGKNVNDIIGLDTREFSKLVKARPRRALLRNYDVIEQFIKRCEEKLKKNKSIKTHNRALVIVPALLGKTIGIYNGKEYIKVEITHEMLGHRLGEFSQTRKIAKHTSLGKKK